MIFFGCKSGSGCNPFSEANRNTDTVKLQMDVGKENAVPNWHPELDASPSKRVKVEQQRADVDKDAGEEAQRLVAQRAVADEELHRRDEAEQLAATFEAWRRTREEGVNQIQQEEAQHQKERQKKQRQLEEAERRRKEEEAKVELQHEDKRRAEKKAMDAEMVNDFLIKHGYCGVNVKRTKMLKSKYPLHTAVKLTDDKMVQLLVSAGANRRLRNSAGETPKQLAGRLAVGNSHAAVLAALA